MEISDLGAKEFRRLLRALEAPPLRFFAVLIPELGSLSAVLRACETRQVDDRIKARFAETGWTEADLPSRADAEGLLLGVQLAALAEGKREKLRAAAHYMKLRVEDAAAAIRVYDRLTGREQLK